MADRGTAGDPKAQLGVEDEPVLGSSFASLRWVMMSLICLTDPFLLVHSKISGTAFSWKS